MSVGSLLGIAIRRAPRAPMEECTAIDVSSEYGLANDSRGQLKRRQVSVLARESWEAACEQLGQTSPWTVRRANLLVEGLPLAETTGATLRIGDLVLEITGETDPCHRMDEQCSGLQEALTPDWRGGVLCRVVRGGSIQIGDAVELSPAPRKQ